MFGALPSPPDREDIFKRSDSADQIELDDLGVRERFQQRLEDGHDFYIYSRNGDLAAYFWLSENRAAPFAFGFNVIVPENVRYIWGCRVLDKFQGQGLYKKMLQEARSSVQAHTREIFITAESDNTASIRGIESAGFAPRFDYRILKLGKFYVYIRGIDFISLKSANSVQQVFTA